MIIAGPERAISEGTNVSLPGGVTRFAGLLAHNYWNLFGPEKRADWDAINRELREVRQAMDTATTDEARLAATERGKPATLRLLEELKSYSHLVHFDVSAPRPELSPAGPYTMAGDTGALLIKVVAGGEGLRYGTTVYDFSQPQGLSTPAYVEVATNGTTYVLLGLEHIASGHSSFLFEFRFRHSDRRPVRRLIDVTAPPPGRLKLAVLSDDTGKPISAMVQLKWLTDGQVRQPGNGIEFASQFDQQGNASGARNANLPGLSNDPFWCMPGPIDMNLAPGRWLVGVRRGAEYEMSFQEVTIRSGETVERKVTPRRWVDMRKRGWWSGDDHVHCRIVSDEDARRLMAWVQAEDVHLANIVEMGDIFRTYFDQRGFGPDYRVVDGEYVLAPGQECPRTHEQIGHTLAMNITSLVRNPDRYFLYDEVFDAVHAQGGLSGYAHVNSGNFHVQRDMSLNVPRQKVDFAEILQFNVLGTDLYYDFLNLGCKLTASSGSDVPWGGTVGEVRAYVFLGKKTFTADAWFDSFRRGHTFTTSGPMIEFTVDHALPGHEIRLKSDRELRIRARAWCDPKRASSLKLEIVKLGDVIRAAESHDPKHPEAQLDFSVRSGYGCWIAARASASDGTSAHTTPVYVMRDGFRFWKFDGIEELIGKRLASLAEIEQIIAEAQTRQAEGRIGNDRYRQQLALQGDALLERVTRARALYEELLTIAAKEREAGRPIKP